MSPPELRPGATLLRLLAIGGGVVLMWGGLVLLGPFLFEREEPAAHPPVGALDPPDPIAHEADVFRLREGDLAVGFHASRRPGVHPRNLETYRRLRAYPGAPPRVPHGLTTEEFRENRCNQCHGRGGYSPRFGAYTPVTPHPEWSDCLQCHAADAGTVGASFPEPGATGEALCTQCHVDPDAPPAQLVSVEWTPREWPESGSRAMEGAPPTIPHEVELRGNCVACHAGPGAVREIRTTHPERTDCRQCHVMGAEAGGAPWGAGP